MRAAARAGLAVLYPLAIGICMAALGVFLGVVASDVAFATRIVVPNAAIDEDGAILMTAFALGGGVLGLMLGTVMGWRMIRPSIFSDHPHIPAPIATPRGRAS